MEETTNMKNDSEYVRILDILTYTLHSLPLAAHHDSFTLRLLQVQISTQYMHRVSFARSASRCSSLRQSRRLVSDQRQHLRTVFVLHGTLASQRCRMDVGVQATILSLRDHAQRQLAS